MHIVPFIEEENELRYFAPHHFKSSRPFTLDPGESALVTLGKRYEKLQHISTGRVAAGESATTMTCRFSNPDKLAVLVTNMAETMTIWVPENAYLNLLLNLNPIKSQFVTIPVERKKKKKKKKTKKEDRRRRCCCPPPPPVEEDSCTDDCNHSNIDDDDDNDDDDDDDDNDDDDDDDDKFIIIID